MAYLHIPVFNPHFYENVFTEDFEYCPTLIDNILKNDFYYAAPCEGILAKISRVAKLCLAEVEYQVSEAIGFVIRPFLTEKWIARSLMINICSFKAIHANNVYVPRTRAQYAPRLTAIELRGID